MESNIEKENRYIRAKERVGKIKKFYTSLMSYVVFIVALAILNYYTNEWRYAWFLWAAFGLGIALFFQGIKAFQWNPFLGKNWEEKKLKEFMEQDNEPSNDRWR